MKKLCPWTLASLLFPTATAWATPPVVEIQTNVPNVGSILLELDPDKAPVTVANFLAYLKEGFYQDTIFHRVPLDFVAQGGGVMQDRTGSTLAYKYKSGLHASIVNEASNGLKNIRGSIAMARGSAANSATSQFFINTVDNAFLDYGSAQSPDGYAVFGNVTSGMGTVDALNALPRAHTAYASATSDPNYQLYTNPNGVLYDMVLIDVANQTPASITAIYLYPTANAGADQTVNEKATVTLDGSASDPGSAASISHYAWTQTGGPTIELTGADSAKPQFSAPAVNADTQLDFQLVVTNAQGKTSGTDTVAITVHDVPGPNAVPEAHAIAEGGAVVRAGALKTLDGSSSFDSDGDAITYLWTAPTGIQLSDATAEKPSFTAPAVGQVLEFSLVVNDGQTNSAASVVSVQVTEANNPPNLAVDTQPVKEGDQVTLNATATDPDGDGIATYHWSQTGGVPVALGAVDGPSLSFTAPDVGAGGTLNFMLTATDDYAPNPQTATDSVSVVVDNNPSLLDCSAAFASPSSLWPPNKAFKPVAIQGVTGPNSFGITITGITSDEPVKNKKGKDTTKPDSKIKRDHKTALLRAERQYGKAGNGRVYTVGFQASDGTQTCTGAVKVGVPPTRNATAVDDAAS